MSNFVSMFCLFNAEALSDRFAEALSDRFAIVSSNRINVVLSAQQLVDCNTVNDGCKGG